MNFLNKRHDTIDKGDSMNLDSQNNEIIDFTTIKSLISELIKNSIATVYLVGSYASNTASRNSDIDLLIITEANQQNQVARHLKDIIKKRFSHITSKIDCKVISWHDLRIGQSKNYLFLFSMINNGKLLEGKPIQMKLIPERLYQELNKLTNLLEEVEDYTLSKKNFTNTGALQFAIGKSLHHLERIISPFNYLSLKEIWGRHLVFLGNLYEKMVPKGVTTSLTTRFSIQKQRSGNFKQLATSLVQLQKYEVRVQETFQKWYDYKI